MSSSKVSGLAARGRLALVISTLCVLVGLLSAPPGVAQAQRKGGVLVPVPPEATPPFDLTASDGAGLQLVSVKVRGVVQDPLAFTELHLRFHNPENRVREGRFRITLPTGATISRFAMKIGDNWMEGEVVERQAARRAYEDFLHRRQDPALLENEAGNEFSARVFPIPAGADKELIVSYSQELPQAASAYRLPLVGLPTLRELDVRVVVAKSDTGKSASSLGGAVTRQEIVEVARSNFRPDQDLVIDRADRGARTGVALRHDNLVVARIAPLSGASLPQQGLTSMLVLFDTSASRALGFAGQVQRFTSLIEELERAGNFNLQVVAFDQTAVPFYLGKANDWGKDDGQRLLARRAEGASDLVGALRFVTERYRGKTNFDRVLVVTDGMATAGETEGDRLRAAVKDLTTIGAQRTDVLAVGGIRDEAALSAMVRGSLPSDGMVLAPDLDSTLAAARLRLATRSGLKVTVAGAQWVWPQTLDGVQPGDEVLVYADLAASRALNITVAGARVADAANVLITRVERPLLERAWIKARLDRLAEQRDTMAAGDGDLRAALVKQMIELSTQHRVLCDYTALLVLETEADYARFGIARRGLADVLTVGPGGVEVMNRKNAGPLVIADQEAEKQKRSSNEVVPEPAPAAEEDRDEAPRERSTQPEVEASAPGVLGNGVAGGVASEAASVQGGGDGRGAAQRRASAGAPPASRASAPSSPRRESARADLASPSSGVEAPMQRMARPRVAAPEKKEQGPAALTGELASIMNQLRSGNAGQKKSALARALAWREREPGNVLAIIALGEALQAMGQHHEAARVFGSIIDLFPSRTDLRRYAAGYLERLGDKTALALAVDCLRKTVEQRPDHPSSHHLLAMALLKAGDGRAAFAAVEAGLQQSYPDGRFAGALQILQEDLGLAAAVWTARSSGSRSEIQRRVASAGGVGEASPSVRFVLSWETDANDVDFHIKDARGGHAYYSAPELPSGGRLYADVTTGYGPECFTVRGKAAAGPYRLSAHYYSRGPMGYGMGRIESIQHDGQGGLLFETRPFVVMNDGAFVDLGAFKPAQATRTTQIVKSGTVLSPVR